ncbi:PAS domain-containing protein [Neobacillus sp. SM06]|uniref:PAS domain-containing protein n=1 Tax=Neobacillus sp. SM06 TaxID=3422492 RepID=UPI003D2A47F4
MFCTLDARGRFQYISPPMQQKFGDEDYREGTDVKQLIHPEDFQTAKEYFIKSIMKVDGFETNLRLKYLRHKWILVKIKAFPLINEWGKIQTILIYLDMIEDMKKEESDPNRSDVPIPDQDAFKKGKRSIRTRMDAQQGKQPSVKNKWENKQTNVPAEIVAFSQQLTARKNSPPISFPKKNSLLLAAFNLRGEITSVNLAAQEITGYTEEEFLTFTFLDLLPPEMKTTVIDFVNCSISTDLDISNKIVTMIDKSGKPLQLTIHALPLFKRGKISGLFVMGKDISKEMELEGRLLRSKQAFYEKYNSIPLCILLLEIDRKNDCAKIAEANDFTLRTLRYTHKEIANKPFCELLYLKNFRMNAFLKNHLEYLHIRTVFLTKDGNKLPAFLYCHLTEWEGKEVILTIARLAELDTSRKTVDKTDSGRQLRVLMAEMDINTMELANLTGLTTATISNLRTGKVKKPNIETAEKIAAALGVNLSYLWPELRY